MASEHDRHADLIRDLRDLFAPLPKTVTVLLADGNMIDGVQLVGFEVPPLGVNRMGDILHRAERETAVLEISVNERTNTRMYGCEVFYNTQERMTEWLKEMNQRNAPQTA